MGRPSECHQTEEIIPIFMSAGAVSLGRTEDMARIEGIFNAAGRRSVRAKIMPAITTTRKEPGAIAGANSATTAATMATMQNSRVKPLKNNASLLPFVIGNNGNNEFFPHGLSREELSRGTNAA